MIVFLHLPKTGGTSFRFILEGNFGIHHCHTTHKGDSVFSQADYAFAKKIFPGLRSMAGHNLTNPTRLSIDNPFFVTILREPIARVISHYQQVTERQEKRMDFEEALGKFEQLENLQVKMIAGERNLDKAKFFLEKQCGFFGLTEKFDLSLQVLDRLSPCKMNLNYLTRRVTKDKSAKKSVQSDPRLLELAREHNKLDLELYSFAVNEAFPRLCERAGLRPTDPVPSFNGKTASRVNYVLGRWFNRLIYRQICKRRKGYTGHDYSKSESRYT